MFRAMLKVEHYKLYRRKLFWIELAVLAAMVVLFFGMMFLMSTTGLIPEDVAGELTETIVLPESLMSALNLVSAQGFGGLLVVILVSVTVAQEYNWQTQSLWLRQGVSRRTVLAAKFVTLLGAVVLLTLTPLLAGGLLTGVFTPIVTGELNLAQIDFVQVVLSVLRTAYTLAPYLALTFLFAVLTRSLAGSIGVGIGYTMLVEGVMAQLATLVGGFPAKAAMFLPGQMAASIAQLNAGISNAMSSDLTEEAAAMMPQYLDPPLAAIGIAVYALVFIGLAFWAFQRQDLTG